MTDSGFLDDVERRRFARWCDAQAHSGRQMLEQIKKLPGMGPVERKMQIEIAAFSYVAHYLQSGETVTVSVTDKEAKDE